MSIDIYELKKFYNSKMGRVVRRILQERIRRFWPEENGMRMLGVGYAVPYMRGYRNECERMAAAMAPEMGALHWPHDEQNCVVLSDISAMPIETNSTDRLIMIHHLEHSKDKTMDLKECWRVLKSNGRMLVIVPNRSGLWSHTEWSPLGHGTPYSWTQICKQLQNNSFIYERSEEALFLPPVQYSPFIKSATFFENIGEKSLPIAAGVHMIEVSKQLYAKIEPGPGTRIPAFIPKILMPKPQTSRNKPG